MRYLALSRNFPGTWTTGASSIRVCLADIEMLVNESSSRRFSFQLRKSTRNRKAAIYMKPVNNWVPKYGCDPDVWSSSPMASPTVCNRQLNERVLSKGSWESHTGCRNNTGQPNDSQTWLEVIQTDHFRTHGAHHLAMVSMGYET